jgi:hypothetical protein
MLWDLKDAIILILIMYKAHIIAIRRSRRRDIIFTGRVVEVE